MFQQFRFVLVLPLLVVMFAASAKAEPSNIAIDSVVVRSRVRAAESKQSAPTQIMGRDKIEALGLQDLHQAVSTFSGVAIKDYGGIGGVKTVSVRSLGAHHTAVSYDGVTISNAQGGQVDIGAISLDNIDEVSLTIGQGDDIFQPARNFASSGLLNIRTSAPKFDDQRVSATSQMKIGSFGTYNPYLNLGAKLADGWAVTANGDWLSSKGDYPFRLDNFGSSTDELRINSDVQTLKSELNIYGDVAPNSKLMLKGYYLDSERGLPGAIIYYNSDSQDRLWERSAMAQARFSSDINDKFRMDGYAKYSYNMMRYLAVSNVYEGGQNEDEYTQQEWYVSGVANYNPTEKWSVTLAQDLFENSLVSTDKNGLDPFRFTSMTALAANYTTSRLTLSGSLLGLYTTEWLGREGVSGDIAPDRKHLSPSVSGSYQLFEDHSFRVRTSVKDGYRLPTFNDLYFDKMGTSSLLPERAMQYNLGFTMSGRLGVLDYVSLSADGYFNSVHDKIVVIPTMFIAKTLNFGEVDIYGVDANAKCNFSVTPHVKCQFSANYTYQYAVDLTNPDSKNYKDQIPYTPKHSGNATFAASSRWFDLGYTVSAVGDRYMLAQNVEANLIDRYWEQNLSLKRGFEVGKCRLDLQFEVLNIGDVMYDVIRFYPMPGRNYRVMLKFKY